MPALRAGSLPIIGQSTAELIEGSLKFNYKTYNLLTRTPGSAGNSNNWTLSWWHKRTHGIRRERIFGAGDGSATYGMIVWDSTTTGVMEYEDNGGSGGYDLQYTSTEEMRDVGEWYHFVLVAQTGSSPKMRLYKNGVEVALTANQSGGSSTHINGTLMHEIGQGNNLGGEGSLNLDAYLSQMYMVDGVSLGPTYFGFTDPLTNTWRPKKFKAEGTTVNDGTVWSNSWGGTGSTGNVDNPAQAFNGNLTNYTSNQNSNTICNWVPSSPIQVKGSLRVYAAAISSGNNQVFVNGISIGTIPGSTPQWYSIQATQLTSIGLNDVGATHGRLYAVEVDGVVMVDSTTTNIDYGTNGFYLPFDGNTPIGEDQSGKGNDWAPVRFGGSNIIDKATGALPALDTQSGGHIALPQVRGNIGVAVTVSGMKYYLDGIETPSLSKYRGQTITFDQSDSTNASHPLKFATAADAAGSTEYTSGVAYAGTPGTSAYYGVDFDGSDFLKVEQSSSQFSGQGDYTIEAWAKFDSFPADGALWSNWNNSSQAYRSILLEINSSGGGFKFYINSVGGGGDWITLNAVAPTPKVGQWYHLCQTYDHSATTTKCYIDGVFYGENTSTTVYNDSNADLHIGINAGNSSGMIDGQVSNFRWSNSVRYTSNFTPSRTPFTTDGNTVFLGCLDSSSATTAVTNTAGTISASGDPSVYKVSNLYGPHTKITIPHTAPDTLYYYCGNHTGMGGSISLSTDIKVADPYAWKCLLAIPFAGDANDYSEEINCTSSQKTTYVSNANVLYDTSNFYGQSYHFDGTSDYITVQTRLPGDWGAENNSFCLEGWVKPDMPSGDGQIFYMSSAWAAGDYFYMQRTYDSSGAYKGRGGGGYITAGKNPANGLDKWDHVAYTCDGTTVRLFVNGNLVGSQNKTSYTWLDSFVVRIGGDTANTPGSLFIGHMQDLRIYFGTAKYTENFIPASTRPDIAKLSPSGASLGLSLRQPEITGAVSFRDVTTDGTGDFLSIAQNADFDLAGDDFTLDALIFLGDSGINNVIANTWYQVSSTEGWLWAVHTDYKLKFWYYDDSGNVTTIAGSQTIAPYRWYHVAMVREGNNFRSYVNGVLDAEHTDSDDIRVGDGPCSIGRCIGYISNMRIVKGTAVYTSNFTPPTGPLANVTNTKLLCCQSQSSPSAYAVSPGAITVNNSCVAEKFNPFDKSTDLVSSSQTTYDWLNQLNITERETGTVFSDGSLKMYSTWDNSGYANGFGNIGLTGGKWYFEGIPSKRVANVALGYGNWRYAGKDGSSGKQAGYGEAGDECIGYYALQGRVSYTTNGNAPVEDNTYLTWDVGDVIGCSIDLTDSTTVRAQFYKNGISIGNAHTIKNKPPFFTNISQYGNGTFSYLNFGQMPFKFPPPEGYQAVGNANLPTPGVVRPDEHFACNIYTGNGSTQYISGLKFQPDLVWIKNRSSSTNWHSLVDSVRGKCKIIFSNKTQAQEDYVSADKGVTHFGVDGFEVKDDSNSSYGVNGASGGTYSGTGKFVGWSWKAGGNKDTYNIDDVGYSSAAAAGLDGGTINPTGASVGTKSGFSIITYTGNNSNVTLSHGLNKAPTFIMMKLGYSGGTGNWNIWHSALDISKRLIFSSAGQDTGYWNSTAPTANVFSIGSGINDNGVEMLAYLWHDVPGLQQFGEYRGNSSADGVYIELGFRPAMIMTKRYDGSSDWVIWDNKRGGGYNPNPYQLWPQNEGGGQTYDAPSGNYPIDFLSTGVKMRTSDSDVNAGDKYIYCAWAEQPLHNLYGATSSAR